MSLFLNKTGIYDKLYHLLWSKPEYLNKNTLNINLPDTILFENRQPLFWYFSNPKGKILKKKTEKIRIEEIMERFGQNQNKSGILAYFISEISYDEYNTKGFCIFLKITIIHSHKNSRSTRDQIFRFRQFKFNIFFIFIGFLSLHIGTFLNDRTNKFPNGILQRFIDPYAGKNSKPQIFCSFNLSKVLIQMIWGKNVTVLTKRINTKNIFNKKVDIYEKCCTFDGPEIYSDSSK